MLKLTLVFREAIWVTLLVFLLFPQESNRHKASPLWLSSHPDTLRRYSGVAGVYGGPSCWSHVCGQALPPAPPGPVCVSSEPCLQHSNVRYARPLRATSSPLPLLRLLAHSLTHSLTQLLPHLTSLRTTNFIRYSFKKTQASWQCAQTTLLKKERERKNERETEWGRRSGREGGIYRKTEEGGESMREIERGRRVVKRETEIKRESDEETECCFYNYRHFCVPGCLIVFKIKSFLLSEDHIKSVKKICM